jgi:hypothetical protein
MTAHDPQRTCRPSLLASPVRGNVRGARPMLSILRLGETNDFASNFRRMRYCGSGSFMTTLDALGQKQSLRDQLVGTWTLLSWEQKKSDGTKIERYGAAP